MTDGVAKLRDGLVIVLVALSLLDGFVFHVVPAIDPLHRAAHKILRPLGLSQMTWELFAPYPVHVNDWIEIDLYLEGGATRVFETRDWKERSWFERLANDHAIKYVEQLSNPENHAVHAQAVRYLVDHGLSPEDPPVVYARLVRHRWVAPSPQQIEDAGRAGKHLPPPRASYGNWLVLWERPWTR